MSSEIHSQISSPNKKAKTIPRTANKAVPTAASIPKRLARALLVGAAVGVAVVLTSVGLLVGMSVLLLAGLVVGMSVLPLLGEPDATGVGTTEGMFDVATEGLTDAIFEGMLDGTTEGSSDGASSKHGLV